MADKSSKRVGYIDAMRGLAMLFVVMGHLSFFCTGSKTVGLSSACVFIEIPLFFMISGFLMYKPNGFIKTGGGGNLLINKILTLVVPAILFLMIYLCHYGIDPRDAFCDSFKNGYWFTLCLFQLWLIYMLYETFVFKIALGSKAADCGLIFLGVILTIATIYFRRVETEEALICLCGLIHLNNFLYIVIGVLIKKHFVHAINLFKSGWFICILCITAWFGYSYSFKDEILLSVGPSTTLYFTLLTIIGILLVFTIFIQIKVLSSDNFVGKMLKLIGVYSLDIYFIHYFVLPRNLTFVGDFFDSYSNPGIEFVFYALLGIVVAYASIAVSKIISLSPQLSLVLLGKRIK